MGSTFKDVGFENLFIKGVLWNLADFKGPPGDDVTAATRGETGDAGNDEGFNFQTINTIPVSTTVITLQDPKNATYDAIIVKTNGILAMATEPADPLKPDGLKVVNIKTHMNEIVARLYANGVPQTVRFTKVKWDVNGVIDAAQIWII
jgi:hypothetical protein